MAKLTKKEVLHVSNLAKLNLSDSEIERHTNQLSNILDHISELEEVDTKNIEPTSQTTDLVNVLREDEINQTRVLNQDEALSGTDNVQNGYFEVPAILNK